MWRPTTLLASLLATLHDVRHRVGRFGVLERTGTTTGCGGLWKGRWEYAGSPLAVPDWRQSLACRNISQGGGAIPRQVEPHRDEPEVNMPGEDG
jgi:hypothetical protein